MNVVNLCVYPVPGMSSQNWKLAFNERLPEGKNSFGIPDPVTALESTISSAPTSFSWDSSNHT